MARVIIVTRGTAGDIVPFLQIGSTLVQRGNDVVFITHGYYEHVARRLRLQFEALDTPEQFDAFVKDGPLLDRPTGILEFSDRHVFPRTAAELGILERWCRDPGVVLLARHMSSIAVPLVCELHSVPFISVFVVAAQANCFQIWAEFCRVALAPRINGFRREAGLPPVRDWNAWVRTPACFLACWPDWFSQQAPQWPDRTFHIGFLRSDVTESGEIPREVADFLKMRPAPVLITAGTSVSGLTKQFYAVAVKACHIAHRPAILVCRHEELLPNPPPPGILHCRELPFASVMPHVAAVIHHGGSGTMVRAVASGVPQLVLPFGADRPENALRIEALGLGFQLAPVMWEPSRVARELSSVIESESIRRTLTDTGERMSSPMDLAKACTLIENLAGTRST